MANVPDTNTFTLEDVVAIITPLVDNLVDAFANANSSFFDPRYVGSKDSLYNFRNYNNSIPLIGSDIYLSSLIYDVASMGISFPTGQTFSITFYYEINAYCDNNWSNGANPSSANSTFSISTNGGSSWTTLTGVSASVSGGSFPIDQQDSKTITGYTTVSGITDISLVRIHGGIQCSSVTDGQNGSVIIKIFSASVDFGTTYIICSNMYYHNCTDIMLDCDLIPT